MKTNFEFLMIWKYIHVHHMLLAILVIYIISQAISSKKVYSESVSNWPSGDMNWILDKEFSS